MSRVKEAEQIVPKIYRRSFAEQSMFWYVRGQKKLGPAVPIEKCLYNYYREMGIEDFNIDCDRVTYYRMLNEYFESVKDEDPQKN